MKLETTEDKKKIQLKHTWGPLRQCIYMIEQLGWTHHTTLHTVSHKQTLFLFFSISCAFNAKLHNSFDKMKFFETVFFSIPSFCSLLPFATYLDFYLFIYFFAQFILR